MLLAPPALARTGLKLGIKTQKAYKNGWFCFWRTKARWSVSALTLIQLENCMCRWVHTTRSPPWKIKYFSAPPGKIFAGAHARFLPSPWSLELGMYLVTDRQWHKHTNELSYKTKVAVHVILTRACTHTPYTHVALSMPDPYALRLV